MRFQVPGKSHPTGQTCLIRPTDGKDAHDEEDNKA